MSAELYEVLALASRYLFALLGVLIVLRAFFWLLTDHADRVQRVRKLPNAGMIGELVVLTGSRDLPEGSTIAVPWEGILGSVRSSDLILPCDGVHRKHLSFQYEPGKGLLLHPCSGCEALVNGTLLTCRSRPEDAPMAHGSFLQIGSTLLRLRIFAGLDPSAGFDDVTQLPQAQPPYQSQIPASFPPQPVQAQAPAGQLLPQQLAGHSPINAPQASGPSSLTAPVSGLNASEYPSGADFIPGRSPFDQTVGAASLPDPSAGGQPADASPRRRRSARWEVDWSE